jgi:hypothetical protein
MLVFFGAAEIEHSFKLAEVCAGVHLHMWLFGGCFEMCKTTVVLFMAMGCEEGVAGERARCVHHIRDKRIFFERPRTYFAIPQ